MRHAVGTSLISLPRLDLQARPAPKAADWWSLWTLLAAPLGRANLR